MPRTLVVDLTCLEDSPLTGVERRALRVAERLPRALPDWTIVGIARRTVAPLLQGAGVECRATMRFLPRPLWRRVIPSREARRLRADIVFCPVAHAPAAPPAFTCRTIHDLPPPSGAWGAWRERRLLARLQPTIAVSQATRAELIRRSPRLADLTTVIHNGVDDRFFAEPGAVAPPDIARPDRYALVLGTWRTRRQPELVRRVADALAARHPSFGVVWVGRGATPGRQGALWRAGHQDDATVLSLVAHAACLIAPSTVEGFGIPVLEAMAQARPVVATDIAATREVAGDVPLYFPPRDEAALVDRVERVLAMPPDEPRLALGREHARRFTWEACAARHAELFRRLAAPETPGPGPS